MRHLSVVYGGRSRVGLIESGTVSVLSNQNRGVTQSRMPAPIAQGPGTIWAAQ